MNLSFKRCARVTAALCLLACLAVAYQKKIVERHLVMLPSSKQLLAPAPGRLGATNGLPVLAAFSPDHRYLALLCAGYGVPESQFEQSIAILDLQTNNITDFPDTRFGQKAHQAMFLGLAFSTDGSQIYATVGSITDPTGQKPGDTGNGVAVYKFEQGKVSPERFFPIALQDLAAGKQVAYELRKVPADKAIPYPAGLAVIFAEGHDQLLVANNLSDNVVLLDAASGKQLRSFDLSTQSNIPAAFPYSAVVTRDATRAFVSLWNSSRVVELDLKNAKVGRSISLLAPRAPTASGSHPSAMLLSPDQDLLYVALANADSVAVVSVSTGQVVRYLSTRLPGQEYGGSVPNALALSDDGKQLFVADASADAVAVFDVSSLAHLQHPILAAQTAIGFIPTDWYPTVLAVHGDDLLIASGKGESTQPNPQHKWKSKEGYIPTLLHGSVARLQIAKVIPDLPQFTDEVSESNLMSGQTGQIVFQGGHNPIRHVIYVIKENRTYDQIFGDMKVGNGDPSLTMFGQEVTPNEHKLALQFGVLDNFYDSGEVSGNGHVWSTAAITSDYNEKTWQIAYRNGERTYDSEGIVAGSLPLQHNEPDVNEPGTGYIWANVARRGLTYRHYGEYVATRWCRPEPGQWFSPAAPPSGSECKVISVRKGQPLPANLGQPHGSPSPWPWDVPMLAGDTPTKPELRGHFDPNFADFRIDYPDQLRVDEFLNEFDQFVRARKEKNGSELPGYVLLRLPNDHTAGTKPNYPAPEASVADNDLAVGRLAEAVSHSPYWDDTAILILEDDAQDGADHVDAHRSIALVISKYSPSSVAQPYVDHHFYTTVNMLRTLEALLGLPPMNNNDARAATIAPLFSGAGNQPPFGADYRNRDNGVIYRMNTASSPGAADSAKLDFSHADAADTTTLNAVLWRERMGDRPAPVPHHVIGASPEQSLLYRSRK